MPDEKLDEDEMRRRVAKGSTKAPPGSIPPGADAPTAALPGGPSTPTHKQAREGAKRDGA